mmetsp:Transcript_34851/g.75364  ORF Transcript_34851/g.75364 Transcript_34851/m.75364 type:complete len:260 (+) Transcript_34851:131-910(+)
MLTKERAQAALRASELWERERGQLLSQISRLEADLARTEEECAADVTTARNTLDKYKQQFEEHKAAIVKRQRLNEVKATQTDAEVAQAVTLTTPLPLVTATRSRDQREYPLGGSLDGGSIITKAHTHINCQLGVADCHLADELAPVRSAQRSLGWADAIDKMLTSRRDSPPRVASATDSPIASVPQQPHSTQTERRVGASDKSSSLWLQGRVGALENHLRDVHTERVQMLNQWRQRDAQHKSQLEQLQNKVATLEGKHH